MKRTEHRWSVLFVNGPEPDQLDGFCYSSLRESIDDMIDIAGRLPCVSVLRDRVAIRRHIQSVPSDWFCVGAENQPEVLVVASRYEWRDCDSYAILVPDGFDRRLRDIAVTGEALEWALHAAIAQDDSLRRTA